MDARPDLVDLAELLKRLRRPGDARKVVSRDELPPAHFTFEDELIWHWPHVAFWLKRVWTVRRNGSIRRLGPVDPLPKIELVTLRTIGNRLMFPESVIRSWSRSGQFPRPDYRWRRGDAWLWSTVEGWDREWKGRASVRLAENLSTARRLLAEPGGSARMAQVIHDIEADQATLLGSVEVPLESLSNSELLARFDEISTRLSALEHLLSDGEPGVDTTAEGESTSA